jgi:phage terminase Nu1 subunit (DNA packaging protein)
MTKGKLFTRNELVKEPDIPATHPQTIAGWVAEGCPIEVRGGPGRPHLYAKEKVLAWLELRKSKDPDVVDLTAARTLKELAQARLNEQKLLELEGKLLPREEVERQWMAELAAIRTRLMILPHTLADRLYRAATLEGVAGVEAALDEEIRNVLEELSAPDRDDAPVAATKKPRRRKKATKKKSRRRAPAKKQRRRSPPRKKERSS